MNIFFLSFNIVHCAQYHCDKHVVKMILETAQLLSIAWHVLSPIKAKKFQDDGKIYRKVFVNHPCSVWTRESKDNYNWLSRLGLALCKEYTHRYHRVHKTESIMNFLHVNIPKKLKNNGFTRIRQCMPDECKLKNPIQAYRKYYVDVKKVTMKCVWTNREIPKWFITR